MVSIFFHHAAAGHLPWLEQPAETFRLLDGFVAAHFPTAK